MESQFDKGLFLHSIRLYNESCFTANCYSPLFIFWTELKIRNVKKYTTENFPLWHRNQKKIYKMKVLCRIELFESECMYLFIIITKNIFCVVFSVDRLYTNFTTCVSHCVTQVYLCRSHRWCRYKSACPVKCRNKLIDFHWYIYKLW